MARTTRFDKTNVLEAALTVFWEKGYSSTSMLDLEKATGLKPGSIYNSFKSKKGLFLSVLTHYQETVIQMRIDRFLLKGGPLQGIESFFRSTYEDVLPEHLVGCLLTNTATELSDRDGDIQAFVIQGVAMLESAFSGRLSEAKTDGLIDSKVDIKAVSVFLTSSFQGLCVIGRLTKDSSRIKLIVDQALATIPITKR